MPMYSLDGRRPALPPVGKCWIAPNACLIGDVRLAEDVGVWFGAILRGDNEPIAVGARTNVQDHCVLHTDMGFPLEIGEDCTVGHNVVLHGCTIGKGTLVGMGALVTEGKAFPDRSLILGSPAKAVRELNAAELEPLRESARVYVRNWRRFAAGLMPLDDQASKEKGR